MNIWMLSLLRSSVSMILISLGMQCIPQRAALLKSMLNFLKKAIQDPAFSDGIRHGESLESTSLLYRWTWDHTSCTNLVYICCCTSHYGSVVYLCNWLFFFFFKLQVMDGSLPTSLKHIISNAEYYGPSLFLLGEYTVTLFHFTEESSSDFRNATFFSY